MKLKKGLKSILASISSKHWVEQLVDEYLDSQAGERRVGTNFHASMAGGCPRLIQYNMNGLVYSEPEPRVRRIFDVGNDMHNRYKRYFIGAKKFVRDEVPIRIETNGIVIVGRADLIVKNFMNEERLLELKSMNVRRFSELLVSNIYIEENFLQWNIYSKGLKLPKGEILYECKDDQKIKSFSVEFNKEKFIEVSNIFKMINDYNIQGKLVPKPSICSDPKYCIAKKICSE